MCPPENIHVDGHGAAFGRAHRPSPTVFSFYFGKKQSEKGITALRIIMFFILSLTLLTYPVYIVPETSLRAA